MMVRVSDSREERIAERSFLFLGRNASKAKRLVGSPDSVRAVMQAAGPGREVTSIPD